MTRRSRRLLPVEHRPLHGVATLAQALHRVPRLLLPSRMHKPTGPWAPVVTLVPVSIYAGWTLMQIPGLDRQPGQWIAASMVGVLTGGALWWMQRKRRDFTGWLIDFEQRSISPIGQGTLEPISLEGKEHSLGCYAGGAQNSGMSLLLELRHVRRGPLAQLCEIALTGSSTTVAQELEQLDQCVDLLVQRLHIRRSGEPLRTAAHRRAAS